MRESEIEEIDWINIKTEILQHWSELRSGRFSGELDQRRKDVQSLADFISRFTETDPQEVHRVIYNIMDRNDESHSEEGYPQNRDLINNEEEMYV